MIGFDSLRAWWWMRGYARFYARPKTSQQGKYAMNAGSEDAFNVLVRELITIIKPSPNDVVLDVGGGDGRLAREVFHCCRKVVVLDRYLSGGRAVSDFVVGDMHHPPFKAGSFTIVFSYSTFATVGAPGSVPEMLERWSSLLQSRGVMFVGDIPERSRVRAALARGLTKDSVMRTLKYYIAIGLITYFSREKLRRQVAAMGYDVAMIDQSPGRRFYRERFDFIARRCGNA